MNEEYGPGGWCICKKCGTLIKHSFVAPCSDVKCSKCKEKLEKVNFNDR